MPVRILPASAALGQLPSFDTVVDARSENEYALDRLPGAVNWPTLNNAERAEIGTIYKQVDPFEARKRGAAIAARNIAAHVERHVLERPKGWRPLVYCWRGGHRSGALATILGAIGFQVTLVEGGYKAWRAALVNDIPRLVARLRFQVVCGPTGSGKTRLLHALAAQGAQVLDLEALARHRSSVLGHLPGVEQPSQKHFDSLIWEALQRFDATQPVFVESESKKVGDVRIPDALMDAMRASPCIALHLPNEERVTLLMEDYDCFVNDAEFFCQRLQVLTELRGKKMVSGWVKKVRAGRTREVVMDLLEQHYDPSYAVSMTNNFRQHASARTCQPVDRSPLAMRHAADELIGAVTSSAPV